MICVLETKTVEHPAGDGEVQVTTAARARVAGLAAPVCLLSAEFAAELRGVLPAVPAGGRRVAVNFLFDADGVTFLYRVADVKPG